MLRIYISSTYLDLQPERRAARDAIHALGHHAVGMEDYSASDERPLDRCLKDVRSCQAYLGIFAWRYGFCPDGEQKSITQLEYEEAKTHNIPRYLFLLREDAPWPRNLVPDEEQPLIKKFREGLRKDRLVGSFDNDESLAAAVTASLATSVVNSSGTPRIPDILPYLCDRSEQEFDLFNGITEWSKKQEHPLVCVIHGEETEAHDKFLERLQKIILPHLLPQTTQRCGVRLYRLEWPSSFRTVEEISSRFTMNLSKEVLDAAFNTHEAINNRLGQNLGPVVIHSHLITENWLKQGAMVLDAFMQFWQEWPPLSVGHSLLIFLFIKYQVNKRLGPSKLRQYAFSNSEMRSLLNESYDFSRFDRFTAKVLRELEGATASDAANWARSEEIGKFCDCPALVDAVSRYYNEWELQQRSRRDPVRIPTDQLVPKLKELISLTQLSMEEII